MLPLVVGRRRQVFVVLLSLIVLAGVSFGGAGEGHQNHVSSLYNNLAPSDLASPSIFHHLPPLISSHHGGDLAKVGCIGDGARPRSEAPDLFSGSSPTVLQLLVLLRAMDEALEGAHGRSETHLPMVLLQLHPHRRISDLFIYASDLVHPNLGVGFSRKAKFIFCIDGRLVLGVKFVLLLYESSSTSTVGGPILGFRSRQMDGKLYGEAPVHPRRLQPILGVLPRWPMRQLHRYPWRRQPGASSSTTSHAPTAGSTS